MTINSITTKAATVALTETMALAWKLIYGGGGVIEAWAEDQGTVEGCTVQHWCVQGLLRISKRAVRIGENLEAVVERHANRLGIDILDVLTSRVDPRLS